jgi:chorismate-pyruvate lyase
MRRAHALTATQYSFALSAQARAIGQKARYELIAMVPVMQRVTRVGFRLREPSHRPLGRVLRASRDIARKVIRPARPPRVAVEAARVESFGAEIQPILDAYQTRAVFFSRDAGMLNHLLRYPCGGPTGWHLTHNGALLGFAILSLVSKPGDVLEGRIVGCMLATDDPDLWHSAMETLTRELILRRADVVLAVASTDWTARALRSAGYSPAYRLDFRLRDRSRAVERASVFHLTFMEADSAYT